MNSHRKNKPSSKITAKEEGSGPFLYVAGDSPTGSLETIPLPLASPGGRRSDWQVYLAIRDLLRTAKVKESAYYGFLPPDFEQRAGIGLAEMRATLNSAPRNIDVYSFTPQHHGEACFINPFVSLDQRVPGFLDASQKFADQLGITVSLAAAPTNSQTCILDNLYAAKPRFWRRWLKAIEKLSELADCGAPNAELATALNRTADAGRQIKERLAERVASLLLMTGKEFLAVAYDPFRLLRRSDDAPLAGQAIICDALKTALAASGNPDYGRVFTPLAQAALAGILDSAPAPKAEVSAGQPAAVTTELPAMFAAAPHPPVPEVGGPNAIVPPLSLVELMSEADRLTQASRQNDVISLYRNWLERTDSPQAFVARFNLGHALSNVGDVAGAIEQYLLALKQHPGFVQARLNLGSMYERLGRKDDAVAEWEKAVGIQETNPNADLSLTLHALNNTGRVLEDLRRFPQAEACLTKSLALKNDQEDVMHHWVHLRQKQCNWPVYQPLPGIPVERLTRATSALATLSSSNDPALQLEVALKFAHEKVRQDLPLLAPPHGYAHDRLRVGYLSSNFGMHAVSLLTAELYELHDRKRVEVWGFCWSPEDNSPMRARITDAMDHFVRINAMSDEAAAQAIRAAEIDILVDLQGLTSGARPNILAHRPAPVQIDYVGFPGTSGIPCVDYVLADRYIIPEEEARYYSEKPLYLPDCFQVNDRKRAAGPVPTRSHYGLPENGIVFCAFGHNHKFGPELFAVWMNILRRTPDSVLWLLADNDRAHDNLLAAARQHGVDDHRLIFGPRVPPTEYLARFVLADLFLDTFPFNGGTTASDALWMGLPILTCSGRTFASRMAGSLLQAIGAPELITTTFAEYEEKAVALAADRAQLAELRSRIEANRATSPLFDSPRWTRAVEDLYEQVAIRP